MERIADIDLITTEYVKDSIGQEVEETTVTATVCGELRSISQQEWFMAAQKDLNPEGMVFLRDSADYSGEDSLEISGIKYSIYRTYLTSDGGIELYFRKKAGDSL